MPAWKPNRREVAEQTRRKRELEQVSIGLAAQAIQELEGPHPERSTLLTLEALENYPYTWQAEKALGKSVVENKLRLVLKLDHEITYAQWSNDGSRLLTTSEDGKARIWDSQTGKELSIISFDGSIHGCWSPDNKSILIIDDLYHFHVVETSSGKSRFNIDHNDIGEEINLMVNDWIPWSPSGQHFLMCYADGDINIHDVNIGELYQSLSGPQGSITMAIWSPDGEFIASSTEDGSQVIIWHVTTGEIIRKFSGGYEDERVIIASWSPTGDRFATRGLGGVKVYDLNSGKQVLNLATPKVWNFRAIWSPDGKKLLTSGLEDGSARYLGY